MKLAMANATVAPALGSGPVRYGAAHAPRVTLKLESGIALDVYSDLAAVERLWRAFEADADCTAFQTFDWLSAWQRHIGSRSASTPAIVVAQDKTAATLLVLPLAVTAGFVRELTWLGSNLCDYNAPLLARDFAQRITPDEFVSLWEASLALIRNSPHWRFDVVRLEKMPETVRAQRNPMLALGTAAHPSGAYATPLADSWDAFYAAKRSSSTRSRDRAKRKRLAEQGKLELVTAKTEAEAVAMINVLAAQKSAHFARHGIANLFARPGYMEFLRDVAGSAEQTGLAHISALHVGAQVAAVNFALTFGGRYYYVLSSYSDGELSRFGPGAVHLQELLHYAIDRKFAIFDFTIGDEPYKRDWCDGALPLYDHLSSVTPRGAARVWAMLLYKTAKRTIKQTPVLWRWFTALRTSWAHIRSHAGTAR
jgi:CelD/BcsL family acetyltransferase involved in cellulose biosynthesis